MTEVHVERTDSAVGQTSHHAPEKTSHYHELKQLDEEPHAPDAVLDRILSQFNTALAQRDIEAIIHLFQKVGYWRDHLASSWDLRTLHGHDKIRTFVTRHFALRQVRPGSGNVFRKPRHGPLDGISGDEGIVGMVDFESTLGRGRGTIRLAKEGQQWRINTLFLSLEEISGLKEPLASDRPDGHHDAADTKNWRERRDDDFNFKDKDPVVLIIGAGQAGLVLSARMKMLGVDTLAIDTNARVGDNWRKRYKQLVLHDPVWYDHMPYLPFPPHWPVFTPKDKLAEWFETYVSALELNVWTRTRILDSSWSEGEKRWTVVLERSFMDGSTEVRTFHPRHLIQATGHSGKKNIPAIKGVTEEDRRVCHSSDFAGTLDPVSGKKAVVVGACNSGHDIAKTLYEKGYEVTMVQRSSTCVISSHAVTNIGLKGLYDESGPPVEDADLSLWGMPFEMLKRQQAKVTKVQAEYDAPIRNALEKAGFKLDDGPDGAGLLAKYFTRGGGYYIDVGASRLIAEGKIKVKQGREILELREEGLIFDDGTVLDADEIVFATGYQNMRTQARVMLGDELADRVTDVWGHDSEGEFRTIYRKTGHPGFWFFGGNLAVCRYHSKILALQIKAVELSLPGAVA